MRNSMYSRSSMNKKGASWIPKKGGSNYLMIGLVLVMMMTVTLFLSTDDYVDDDKVSEGSKVEHIPKKQGAAGENIGSKVVGDGKSDKWILDSGAAAHICMHRAWFNDYQIYDGANFIIVANGAKVQIRGVGSISLMMRNGQIINLHGVLYAPEVMDNIISLSKLDNEGFEFTGIGGVLKIMRRTTKEIMTGVLRSDLYIMDGRTLIPSSSTTETGTSGRDESC